MSEVKKRSGKGKKGGDKVSEVSNEIQQKSKKDDKKVANEDDTDTQSGEPPPPKFGPMPKLSPHRLWSRTALIIGLMTVVWYQSGKKNEQAFAKIDEEIRFRGMKTKCSSEFDKGVANFKGCVPNHCGRVVTDEIITPEETFALLDFAHRVFRESKQDGAAVVFDFISGNLRSEDTSLDLFKLSKTKKIFQSGDLMLFQSVKGKLMRTVSSYFGVDFWSIFMASPSYFTKLTPARAKTKSEEYWHVTSHRSLHPSFDYTTTLYFSDFGKDFEGGRLIFVDGDNTNRTVDPKKGRAISFTSGEESKFFNEKVTKGNRYAMTIGITCDPTKAKKDPQF